MIPKHLSSFSDKIDYEKSIRPILDAMVDSFRVSDFTDSNIPLYLHFAIANSHSCVGNILDYYHIPSDNLTVKERITYYYLLGNE